MSNLKEPLLKHNFFPDDTQKNQDMKRALDDIYHNASWRDVEIETVTPSKESMLDGEEKIVDVDGTVRKYFRRGNNIYFADLTKVA